MRQPPAGEGVNVSGWDCHCVLHIKGFQLFKQTWWIISVFIEADPLSSSFGLHQLLMEVLVCLNWVCVNGNIFVFLFRCLRTRSSMSSRSSTLPVLWGPLKSSEPETSPSPSSVTTTGQSLQDWTRFFFFFWKVYPDIVHTWYWITRYWVLYLWCHSVAVFVNVSWCLNYVVHWYFHLLLLTKLHTLPQSPDVLESVAFNPLCSG